MNLRDRDNLRTKDKGPVPKVSFVRRLDCIILSAVLCTAVLLALILVLQLCVCILRYRYHYKIKDTLYTPALHRESTCSQQLCAISYML